MINPDISNVVLWLSAASDNKNQTAEEIEKMEVLIRRLAREIFAQGGTIVHGMHPVITKWLVEELNTIPKDRRKNALQLVVSQFFPSDLADEYSKTITVIRIPASDKGRDASLWEMRRVLSSRCNSFVAIGGKLHLDAKGRAGITIEIDFARNAGLPCYVLGGFGGDAHRYAESNRLDNLRNGLSFFENGKITESNSVEDSFNLLVDGLSRLPLERSAQSLRDGLITWPGRFRILSLNGGGIKGAFSAAVLSAIEKVHGCNIAEYFDLVSGTSTGGLIALGLGAGAGARKLLDFYRDKGSVVFHQGNVASRCLRWLFKGKYEVKGLEKALSEIVGEKCLKDSCCRLLIPSFSADDGRMHYFTTPHNDFCQYDGDVSMFDVARATSAAPSYLPPAEVGHADSIGRYLDGGVGANMPMLIAVLHAVHYLGVDPAQIDVLSIGTTTTAKGYIKLPKSLTGWLSKGKIVDLYSNAQESFMQGGVDLILRPNQCCHIDSLANEGDFAIDELKRVKQLISRGESAIREEKVAAFLKSKIINGVPAADWKAM